MTNCESHITKTSFLNRLKTSKMIDLIENAGNVANVIIKQICQFLHKAFFYHEECIFFLPGTVFAGIYGPGIYDANTSSAVLPPIFEHALFSLLRLNITRQFNNYPAHINSLHRRANNLVV